MLYILNGDVQTGKTRWLQSLVASLQDLGTPCHGVLSPGLWVASVDMYGAPTYEKLGIETIFLPEMTRAPFARRRDLQDVQNSQCQQSDRAQLGWSISDAAIDIINAHFDRLSELCRSGSRLEAASKASSDMSAKGLLIVDELGRLELECGQGFSSAMELLRVGSTTLYEHALVVVRSGLEALAKEQLAPYWSATKTINANEDSRQMFMATLNPTARRT